MPVGTSGADRYKGFGLGSLGNSSILWWLTYLRCIPVVLHLREQHFCWHKMKMVKGQAESAFTKDVKEQKINFNFLKIGTREEWELLYSKAGVEIKGNLDVA